MHHPSQQPAAFDLNTDDGAATTSPNKALAAPAQALHVSRIKSEHQSRRVQ